MWEVEEEEFQVGKVGRGKKNSSFQAQQTAESEAEGAGSRC